MKKILFTAIALLALTGIFAGCTVKKQEGKTPETPNGVLEEITAKADEQAEESAGISEKKVVGKWIGEYTYNENLFTSELTFNEGGTYTSVTYMNGEYDETREGNFEIRDGEVATTSPAFEGTIYYKYVDGKLENNGHYYEKVK